MDPPMFYRGNDWPLEPGMVLFAHMILMDSETETAMCLGRTSIVAESGPEPLADLPEAMLRR
jgi:Xaa-Pro dipeptidase